MNILRGNASDTLTIQAIPDLTSSLSVGTTANPFDATTVAGTINLNGSLTLNAKTIAVNAPTTTATAVTLVAVNTATQTAAIQTPTLNLGGAGNAGIYTLTNAGNDADSLTAGAAVVSYTDVDDLNLAGIGVATLTLNTGLLTDSAPTSVTGTTQLNAGTVTLDDAANDFNTLGITSTDSVTIVESNAVTLSTVTIARNFTLTAGGDVTDDATVTVGELATLKAANITLDSATNDFANVTVPAVGNLILVDANNVILLDTTATGAVLVKAGATLTVPAGKTISGNTLEFQVDTLAAANGTGGTANLVGANLIAPAGAKLNGGNDPDTFNISKYTAALTVNGNDPTTFPGDRLFANGEGVNGLSQPVPGQLSLGGGLVTFTNIEQLIPVNTPTIALVGSTGDDTAIVNTNAAGKVVSYQLTLNGVAFPLVDVTTSNLLSFTFDGLDGNDTMIVNLATGLTSLTTAITFLGNSNTLAGDAGDKLAVVGTNQVATVLATPTATDAGAGTVTVGASAITYKGLEGAVDLTSLSTVDVRFAGGDDEITIATGKRLISSDAAIRVTGKTGGLTFAPIALNTIGTATVDTANVLGAAAITITGTGDKDAHRINNLNVNASSNADGTITVNGPVSLTGNLTATADVVTSTSNITVGGALIVNALDTLQLTGSQIQGATVVFNVDSTDTDAAGGTANLVGTAIVSQNAPAQLNGGEQNDEFLVDAGYTSTLNIAARVQSGVDRLQVAGTAVRISDVSLTSDGKADVNFTGIEQVQLNGAGTAKVATNVTILGDKAPTAVTTADVLTVARTAATEFTLTLTLNGLPIVAPASLDILAVQLGNDIDTTTFTQTANGGPLPNGTTTITNTAGDDEVLVVGLGGQGATVVGSGTVAKTATATIDGKQLQLNNVRGLSLDKFASVELQYAGASDELDVAAGTLAISGGAALATTGKSNTQTQIQIAAANTTNLTINTAAAGDGADIVRLGATGAATTHNVTNFTLRTGIGGDSVEVTGDNAFTGNLAITTGGNLTVSKNILAKNVTLETTDAAAAGQDVLVRGGVTIEASETIVINAGDNLTARGATLKAGNTITLQIDANSADDEGAIADLNNTIVQAKNSTLTGNTQNDTFTLTNTATPLSINGKAPTNTSTGDTLIFDTKQELLVATAGSFNNVSYADIEAIQVLNAKAVSFNGGNVDDRLVLTKSTKDADALPFQYQLDSLTPVKLAVPTVFSFAGLAKSDTLVVDLKTNGGVEIPAGGINFDGGADADVGICVLGNGQTAIYTADSAATGKIVVNDRTIAFANLETSSQVDITGMTRVDVTTSIANDTLEINEGLDATAGKSNMALIVSGPGTPRVGLWKNATVNVLTDTVSGSDTVTITRAANAHANVNLTVDTGLGNDTLAVNGPMMFTGNLTLRTQTASIANNANLMASSITIANTKTLTVGTATLLASNGQVRQLNSGSVVLNGALTVTATDRVLFTGAIDGPGSLAVNTPVETRFDRKLGETKAIDSLVTDKGGNVSFGETLVRTNTKQQFGETVTFDKQAMMFEGLGGTIQFDGTLDSLLADADLVVGGPNVDITFGGAVGSKAALRTLTISNARNATANGAITTQRFEQKAGTGTTTLNGPVTATGSTAVTNFLEDGSFGQIRGGAVNLITDKIAINNTLEAKNGSVVLQANNGVLQKSELSTRTTNDGKGVLLEIKPGDEQNAMKSKLTTQQLYLSGSGDFALLGSQNQLKKDAIGPNIPTTSNLFANLSSGKVEVFDASRLVLNFDAGNTNKAIITIGGNGTLNLFTNCDLTAEDIRTSDANIDPTTLPTLISVVGGTVTIIPGLLTKAFAAEAAKNPRVLEQPETSEVLKAAGLSEVSKVSEVFEAKVSTTVRYLNETVASRVTIGTAETSGLINNGKDTFFVRPMIGAALFVNGNRPTIVEDKSERPWDRLSPRFKNVDSPSLQSFGPGDGRYTFSGSRNFQPLSFTSIESLAGLSLEAFVVQTGPSTQQPGNTYAIRVQASQTSADLGNDKTKLAGAIRGNGVITNPFVVTPNRSSSTSSFRQPTITSALVDNDDTPDLIIAGGAGDAPLITIIRGSSFLGADKSIDLTLIGVSKDFKKDLIAQFYPFEESFRGGLQVSAGDFDNDGFAEIVVGAGDGGGPRVSVFSISNRQNDTNANVDVFNNAKIYTKNGQEFNFFPYESSFRGGVNVAAGDVNGDGIADIIAGAGNGGGPRVRVYSGADKSVTLADYFAFESSFRGGVLVAAGRYDSDTTADVMMAAGPGGGARIRVLAGSVNPSQLLTAPLADFFAYGPEYSLGVDRLPIDEASTLTGRTFPGIGAIAFGSSTAGDGSRRSILVSTPRGEEFQIFRFNPDQASFAPSERVLGTEDALVVGNPIEGVADLAQLRDGSSIGGFTTETLDKSQ